LPLMTTWEAMQLPSPICTPAEMKQKGPITTCGPIMTPGSMILLAAIVAEDEINADILLTTGRLSVVN